MGPIGILALRVVLVNSLTKVLALLKKTIPMEFGAAETDIGGTDKHRGCEMKYIRHSHTLAL